MAIDSALGRLGIKQGVCTSSTRPTNPFEGQVIYESDTNRTLVYDNAAWIVVADNQVLSIDAANGRVGIGTDTPEANLDINGNSPSLLFTSPNDTNRYRIDANISDVADYGMSLGYWDGAAYQRTLTVDATGKVGIKDTAPSYPLDVNGDINATGNLRVSGNPVGLVLVKSQDIGYAVSSVTVTGAFSSAYDNYRVVLVLQDSSNNTAVHWTSPQETGSQYNYAGYYMNLYTPPTGASYFGAASTTSIQMGFTTSNSTGDGGAMTMDIFGPNRSDQQTKCMSTSTTYIVHNIWGRTYTYTALSDITFSPVAGNFNGGKILIYGYAE